MVPRFCGNKSGCPIKDFGHDTNKNSNLYTDTNYRKKFKKERDRENLPLILFMF